MYENDGVIISLKNVHFKNTYFSPRDDIVSDFFVPLLNHSFKYDRGTGFFTTQSLVELSQGIMGLLKNGGSIRMITSPRLSKEDWEAINNGYDLKL